MVLTDNDFIIHKVICYRLIVTYVVQDQMFHGYLLQIDGYICGSGSDVPWLFVTD